MSFDAGVFGPGQYVPAYRDFEERAWPYLQKQGVSKDAALVVYFLTSVCDRIQSVEERVQELREAIEDQ